MSVRQLYDGYYRTMRWFDDNTLRWKNVARHINPYCRGSCCSADTEIFMLLTITRYDLLSCKTFAVVGNKTAHPCLMVWSKDSLYLLHSQRLFENDKNIHKWLPESKFWFYIDPANSSELMSNITTNRDATDICTAWIVMVKQAFYRYHDI